MAIPSAQNSVVGSATVGPPGKLAGINSMMRELGGVFGIAVAVAVFEGFGGYASAQAFTNGFGPAIWVSSGLALLGAACGLALPARRHHRGDLGDPVTCSNPQSNWRKRHDTPTRRSGLGRAPAA